MSRGKIILLAFITGFVVLVFAHRRLLGYALQQAVGQLRVVVQSRPIEDVLADNAVADSIKSKIELVRDVRYFAFDSLGIDYSDNYTTYYDQQGRDVLWVVTACEPFALKAYTWSFPIIGSFGYKGFFDSLRAVNEAESLDQLGYDTSIRPVGGWSTLGYFRDPILSKMLERSEAGIAELIIHELTHGTIYVKDSTVFNENLATFIGIKGAEMYTAMRYGGASDRLARYRMRKADRHRMVGHILRGAQYLDSLYRAMGTGMTYDEKRRMKRRGIDHIIAAADSVELSNGRTFGELLEGKKPNNTYFMSYLRYRGYLDELESEYIGRYGGDLKVMLADYKRRFPSL